MSKVCEICGRGSSKRNNQRHTSHNKKSKFANRGPRGLTAVKSSQTVRPNFRQVQLEKGMQRVTTCMRCYKMLKTSLPSVAASN